MFGAVGVGEVRLRDCHPPRHVFLGVEGLRRAYLPLHSQPWPLFLPHPYLF